MNLAYFRESNFGFRETLENLKKEIENEGLKLLAEVELENHQGVVLTVCSQEWLSHLVASDKNLIGLLPCLVVVLNKGDELLVGVGNPSIIGRLTDDPSVLEISQKAEKILKSIIEKSCGVGPLKVKKVKLYATLSCPYCKMEAAWLENHKIEYERIYVDMNPAAGEEIVRKTGQLGVPVTEIVYDNDEEEYLIGFDRARLEEIFKV